MPTVQAVLQETTEQLRHAGFETARLDAECLLCVVLQKPRSFLYGWADNELHTAQIDALQALLMQRLDAVPIAYLLGTREFWSLDLQVTIDTLVPRPETELLVELALEKIPLFAEWRIADLGTGSGAIALAIAHERPQCQVLGTDQSLAALQVAQMNSQHLQLPNLVWLAGDWLQTVMPSPIFDVIVSNPPYLAVNDVHLQGEIRHEPRSALVSGVDGLNAIREIITTARARLKAGGWLFLEHGYQQAGAVTGLLRETDYQKVGFQRDMAGLERVSFACMA